MPSLVALLLAASPAWAAPASLSLDSALQEATNNNPTLAAAVHDYQAALANVDAEDALYAPKLLLDAGVTHTEVPRLSQNGTTLSGSDTQTIGGELQHTFPWGTQLSLRLQGDRTTSSPQTFAGTSNTVSLGPGYGLTARATVTQPLLRGFGTEVGESSLRQALLNRSGADKARDRVASEMLRDVMMGYWELWYAERALAIEQGALELAGRRRDEAKQRIAVGADAPFNLLTFETRVAELERAVLQARGNWLTQSLSLSTALGRSSKEEAELHATGEGPAPGQTPNRTQTLQAAREESYAVLELRTQLDLAQERSAVAGEASRSRLDLQAYVEGQGLGNRAVSPAVEQLVEGNAISAHIGVVFELPLSSQRYNSQKRAAEASRSAVQARLRAAEQQAELEASSQLVVLQQAERGLELARQTVGVAEQNVAAQQKRLERGTALPLEVHEAEDELRRAQLAVTRAEVDAALAHIRLDHVTGTLLASNVGRLRALKTGALPATKAALGSAASGYF